VALLTVLLTSSLPAAHAQAVLPSAGTSFNSSFNGGHAGWSAVNGAWKQTSAYYTTTGTENQVSSIKHAGSYKNFVFSVRMKRTGSATSDHNSIFVRGDSSSLVPIVKYWDSSYEFWYGMDATWALWRWVGGSATLVHTGSGSPVLSGSSWNVLKVVMYGSVYAFYINGTLVTVGSDTNLSSGSVGIGMYRASASTNNKLYVDWAKLQVVSLDAALSPSLSLDGMDQAR
jgi:hypothetical protein